MVDHGTLRSSAIRRSSTGAGLSRGEPGTRAIGTRKRKLGNMVKDRHRSAPHRPVPSATAVWAIAPQERRDEVTAAFIACSYALVGGGVIATGVLDLRSSCERPPGPDPGIPPQATTV